MSRIFNQYDAVEKKYIFNSFLLFVVLVEIVILGATCIWQIDDGWFGGEVRVVPFPWKEYLLTAFTAPIVMIFLFGMIIKGFDAFAGQDNANAGGRRSFWQTWRRRGSIFTYCLSLLGVLVFIYSLWRLDKVLPFLKGVFSLLGLWGTYIVIGLFALGMLYVPLSLLLRYRLQKKAMEYQYLLTLAQRHGLTLQDADGKLVVLPLPGAAPVLPPPEELPPASDEAESDCETSS